MIPFFLRLFGGNIYLYILLLNNKDGSLIKQLHAIRLRNLMVMNT